MALGTTSPNPQSTRRVVAFYPLGSPEINGAWLKSRGTGRALPRGAVFLATLARRQLRRHSQAAAPASRPRTRCARALSRPLASYAPHSRPLACPCPRSDAVNVVCTSLGADYTKMGSFGDAYDFGYGVAAGMTRPKPKQGPRQISELIGAKSIGDKYFVEYTVVRRPPRAPRPA